MKKIFLFLSLLCFSWLARAEENFISSNDVTWTGLGTNENSSMPLGNGDVALNAWTEQNGDIVLLIAKGDSWSENCQLLKLGRVRIKLTPNPFVGTGSMTQTLLLEDGEIQFKEGASVARLWVDANHPVIHLEVQTEHPTQMEAKVETWRTESYSLPQNAVAAAFFEWQAKPDGLTFDPDTILPAQNNRVTLCHFNTRSIYPLVFEKEHLDSLLSKYPDPLLHRCFGLTMKGPGLASADALTLKSAGAFSSLRLDIYALTRQVGSPQAWQSAMNQIVASTDAVPLKEARMAHWQWWMNFWNRSWIHLSGTPDAEKVSQSYAIERFMTACTGRGAYPIRFNGSLFTVGHDLPKGVGSTAENHDPDFRKWGNSYWNQNTRLEYWPLMATGDTDLMAPWFQMYVQSLPLVKDRTRAYFHHDGASFIETIYFWGLPNVNDFGWDNKGNELESAWMRYHIQGGIEVVDQMLDFYDYTQNAGFARTCLLPMAEAVVTYYDQHWLRGADGKIHMEPSQSLETYQGGANPTPDIAGLRYILPRLLALPFGLGDNQQRTLWRKVLADLPPIPLGKTANGKLPPQGQGDAYGKPTILPAQVYGNSCNVENPELYTVFPYKLYGVGKPQLELARTTYQARLFDCANGWSQDGIDAADLGLPEEAKSIVTQESTFYGDQRFPWFWKAGFNWIPNMDNGCCGMITLQDMLMICEGTRIQLLPAWPMDWTADFKLHAPYQTTVEGHVEKGRVTHLKVIPASRAKDVVFVQPTP